MGAVGYAPDAQYDYTTCPQCGTSFGSPVVSFRRKDGKDLYCPNGHVCSWRESETDKLRAQLAKAQSDLGIQKTERLRAESNFERSQNSLTRLKRRVKAGVCPCCHRSVLQLARHMKTKHPNYAEKLEPTT